MGDAPDPAQEALRRLPSVDEVLRQPGVAALAAGPRRPLVRGFVQALLDSWRGEIRAGRLGAGGLASRLSNGGLAAAVAAELEREQRAGLRRVLNATGVVLNTGLGRAPVHPEAAQAMAQAAMGYCTLEVDPESGARGQRDERLSELLVRLTGAEAGIAVNNNAAAVFLLLSTFAQGREAIVSRGELVEIGGSFRMPDVMVQAGVELREVGTTNRTRLADYRAAVGERTGLLLKVHTSNYRVIGFTEEVSTREIAGLGRELGVTSANDLGSGLLELEGTRPLDVLGREPLVREEVASGVDVVTFSGDKLLGGPQAGFLVGRGAAIAALRKNPIYRAMRLDKVAIAGLERTLQLLLDGRGDELPARRMLLATAAELRPRAEALARALAELPGLSVSVAAERSQPGSGAAPDIYLDTFVVSLGLSRGSTADFARRLRLGQPAVFARVQADRILLDPRTLLPGEDALLVAAVRAAAGR
jgi:L-seryl-tRNA(Ser) seleniumtransferase